MIQTDKQEVQVSFLKKTARSQDKYEFPGQPDIGWADLAEIVPIKQPELSRRGGGYYCFGSSKTEN